MNKNINSPVSSCILASLLVVGCSQQQIQTSGAGPSVASSNGNIVLDGSGQPVKDGMGSVVRSSSTSSTSGMTHAGSQQVYEPQVMDSQIPAKVVPKTPQAQKPVPQYHPMVKPVQTYKHRPMVKPVQVIKVRQVSQVTSAYSNQTRQCKAKVKIPASFKTVTKKVQISPAVNKRVKVRDAQYRYVSKHVQVRPASHHYEYIPAQYKTVTKHVLVKPAHYVWQKGKKSPIQRIDNMTGEIMCRVKIPAAYKQVNQKVLVRAAQRVKKTIPAVYRTVKHKQLVSPAQYRNIHQPARFVNKSYRIKTSDVSYKWQPIKGC